MQLSRQRMQILRLLYEERTRSELSTLSLEEMAPQLGISTADTWDELTYLEESGYVSIRTHALGSRFRHTLAITVKGIDVVESASFAPEDSSSSTRGAQTSGIGAATRDGPESATTSSGERQSVELKMSNKVPRGIFISHSHHDNVFCRRLVAHLWRHFPETDVFFDEAELKGGDDWIQRIPSELMRRPIFIVVLSEQSVAAWWVQEETRLALREAISNRERTVIPVRYLECDSDEISPLLRSRQVIDCAYQDESIGFAQLVAVIQRFPS